MISPEQAEEAQRIIREWGPLSNPVAITEPMFELLDKLADVMLDQYINRTYDNDEDIKEYILGFLCTAATIGYIDNDSDVADLINELDLD